MANDNCPIVLIPSSIHCLTMVCSPKLAMPDIPKTINGKTMEIAVKNIINGTPLSTTETLANPDSLTYFKKYADK